MIWILERKSCKIDGIYRSIVLKENDMIRNPIEMPWFVI